MTEHDLRELLERDSQDGPHRGVTVADVGRRVRRIRRRRVQVLGSLTAAAAAVVMAAWLPSAGTAPAPAGVWTGELAQPTPTRTISLAPLHSSAYERGGTRETFSAVWAPEVRKVGFWITCEPAAHVLIWVNGELVDNGPCEVGPRPPARVAGGIPVRAGERNEFAVALIPETVAGATAKGAEWAAEALSRTAPYPLRWRVEVVDDSVCQSRHVAVEAGSGKIIQFDCELD
ncbi:hypothetical protein [Nonomuraea cavernae]|uniref:hypothetical protein n=1 Tax=Nonomuraea cavernae TaxID=2045107 RepID=UPI0033E5D6DA